MGTETGRWYNKRVIQAIIFDCFGVVRPDMLRASYAKFGGDPGEDREFIADTLYASHTGRIGSSAPVFAEHLGVSEATWFKAITSVSNDEQLLAYITELRKQYKIGMLSNVGRDGLLRYFTQTELDAHFDSVVVSGEIGFAKPEAQAYEITADRLRVLLNECVFTDDKPAYCEAARAVGMQAIVYDSFDQFRSDLRKVLAK